jgi:hypothetical protein
MLAHAMRLVDYLEGEGSGLPRAIQDSASSGAPEPTARFRDGFVTVIVRPSDHNPDIPDPARSGRDDAMQVWNVPVRSAAFTGRDALLAAVRERLTSGGRVAVQALHGMGGVGKTLLAVEFAHRYAGDCVPRTRLEDAM